MGFSAHEIVEIVRELGSCTALNLAILGVLVYMYRRHRKILKDIHNGINGEGGK